MLATLKNAARPFYAGIGNMAAVYACTGIKNSRNEMVRCCARGLDELLTNSFTETGKSWINRIEDRRATLLQDDARLAFLDFGAGSNREGATKERAVKTIAGASKPRFLASILYKIIRHIGPKTCVEMGSCVGLSAAYQSAALTLNTQMLKTRKGSKYDWEHGHLVSIEGDPQTADIARETLRTLNIENAEIVTGSFDKQLEGVLKKMAPVEYLFNDGHHDGDAVLRYFETAYQYMADQSIIVFDDIDWSESMADAWRQITIDRRIFCTINLGGIGVAFIDRSANYREAYRMRIFNPRN